MAGAKLLVLLVLLSSLGVVVWGRELVERSKAPEAPEVPAAIAVSPESFKLVLTVYAKGHQHYRFNGSSWVLFNATAKLYTVERQSKQLLGYHFFLPKLDARGGRPTWRSGGFNAKFPFSSVTAKPVSGVVVDSESITWVLLKTTQAHGDKKYFGEVGRVQRYKTKGGLAPTSKRARVGATKKSAYTCVYSYYIAAK